MPGDRVGEFQIFATMACESCELVDFGVFYLEFRRPADGKQARMWDDKQFTGLAHRVVRRVMLRRAQPPRMKMNAPGPEQASSGLSRPAGVLRG